ncbi:TPA: hypothetical protein DD394_04870 [bacterium UBP9_UBA11836]|nr:hypothetical protein [bacterium UBP9_UBA11836]
MSIISSTLNSAVGTVGGMIGTALGNAIVGAIGNKGSSSVLNLSGINIAKISNAKVYLNSGALLGMAETVTGLAAPKPKFGEFKALGLLSNVNLFDGFEQPEVKIKWTSIYSDLAPCLFNPLAICRLQIRASQETYLTDGTVISAPVVVDIHGRCSDNTDPSFEQGKATSFESTFKADYGKLTINGNTVYEYDVMGNKFTVGGSDVFAAIFANLG